MDETNSGENDNITSNMPRRDCPTNATLKILYERTAVLTFFKHDALDNERSTAQCTQVLATKGVSLKIYCREIYHDS